MENEIICSICGVKVKYTEDIGQFLLKGGGVEWHGSILNRNGKQYNFWFCPIHSVIDANDFEHQTMRELGVE